MLPDALTVRSISIIPPEGRRQRRRTGRDGAVGAFKNCGGEGGTPAAAHPVWLGHQRRAGAPGERFWVTEDHFGSRAVVTRVVDANHVDGTGLAEQAGDQVEIGVHHVQCQGVQAEAVSLPQQCGAALDLQYPQLPIPLIGHRLTQLLVGGTEPREHVHECPAAGRLLGRDDAVSLFQRGG
jgi:hypothetical protein